MEVDFFSYVSMPVILVFITVFLLCYVYLGGRSNFPPGPAGLPVLGNILWFSNLKKRRLKQYQALFEASKKYGDIVSMTVLGQRFVYLHGYETIRDAFVKKGDVLSSRPSWLRLVQEAIKEGKGMSSFLLKCKYDTFNNQNIFIIFTCVHGKSLHGKFEI